MKLVKILSTTPTVGIKEAVSLDEYVLISDAKYRLLQFNHVKMDIVMDFVDSSSENVVDFNREKPYIVSAVIDTMPTVADGVIDCKSDLADVEVGKCIFYFAPKPPVAESELLTEEEMEEAKEAMIAKYQPVKPEVPEDPTQEEVEAYQKAMVEYTAKCNLFAKLLAEWNIKEKNNTKWTAEYTKYNAAVNSQAYGVVIEKVSETEANVVGDLSFLTTKTDIQNSSYGRFPLDAPLKVGNAVGGFVANDSLKGMTWVDIMAKTLGLTADTPIEKVIDIT